MRLSRYRLSALANAFIFPRLSPLPAYTAESDEYEDNEDSKLNKRSESQKGELHMNFTILSYYNNFHVQARRRSKSAIPRAEENSERKGQSINLKIPL